MEHCVLLFSMIFFYHAFSPILIYLPSPEQQAFTIRVYLSMWRVYVSSEVLFVWPIHEKSG
jgi:hypothetical protein